MRIVNFRVIISGLTVALFLAGCSELTDEEKNAELGPLNAIDATGLNDIMLNLADPNEAVVFFRESLSKDPERVDLKRNYALALVRAKKYAEAALIFEQLIESGDLSDEDRLLYADALVRNGAWEDAEKQLDLIPPSIQNFKRYFLEAILADHNEEWESADSFYDIARGLTTRPAQVLNNWGISKLGRGQISDAEKLFKQAIAADPKLFAAKNNLVISRGKREIYTLPVMPMTDAERAVLMFNLAREAVKNGDVEIAKGLLSTAIETHPQHFEAAVALLGSL